MLLDMKAWSKMRRLSTSTCITSYTRHDELRNAAVEDQHKHHELHKACMTNFAMRRSRTSTCITSYRMRHEACMANYKTQMRKKDIETKRQHDAKRRRDNEADTIMIQ